MITLQENNNTKKNTTPNDSVKKEISDDIKNNLDNFDVILLSKLSNLKGTLSSDRVNLQSVRQQIKDISNYDQSQNFIYLNTLLHPEKARGCKIPSQVPVPSCGFQLHNCVTVSTNSLGNVAVMLNPFFLASDEVKGTSITVGSDNFYVHKFLTSLWVNNDESLTGSDDNINWTPTNISQTLPDVYDQYRLVSASMVVKYIGRLDAAQGVIGGAIIYDQMDTVGGQLQAYSGTTPYDPEGVGTNTVCPELTKYGNFDLGMDSFYHQGAGCLEGVRELYFPIDNNFEEYAKVVDGSILTAAATSSGGIQYYVDPSYYKSSFNWFFYALGCPYSQNCFKIDIYCNFECLPKAKYLNYMPISINPYIISLEEKKHLILTVQNKPILKENEEGGEGVLIPSIFLRMVKKFRNGLPSFDKLRAFGLLNAIPSLKPGLALAGNMIQNTMDID